MVVRTVIYISGKTVIHFHVSIETYWKMGARWALGQLWDVDMSIYLLEFLQNRLNSIKGLHACRSMIQMLMIARSDCTHNWFCLQFHIQ